ncbi:histidine kinase N-terminal 7TM domain-containing protein [Deinococcus sonorensis]|uniref:Histidine kinase N-terminal 7TM domain-containing protein n=2 Tax=Deinococcus sonorensis TaxID=309891 RepID=A0AAU7U6Q8_9DEIO
MLAFVVSLILTLCLGLVAAGRKTPAAQTFFWLMVSLSIWTGCYILELSSVTESGKRFWLIAKYLGAAPAPVVWFLFSLYATSREAWLNRTVRVALTGWVLLTLGIVWTNSAHHLMWMSMHVEAGQPELQVHHGPFFWAYAAAIYAFILTSVALFFNFYRTTQPLFRRQGLLLTLGGFAPLAGRMSEDLFGLDLLPRVDEVVFFFLLSGIFFALALFRYNTLRVVPIAHHTVIHNIRAGIVVLDPGDHIIDLNPFARELFGPTSKDMIGARLPDVLPSLMPAAMGRETLDDVTFVRDGVQAHFSLHRSPIPGPAGRLNGHALVLFDITARREAERQLEVQAQTDALTGVTNRRRFLELAETQVQDEGGRCAVLMLDIDRFKTINDTHGHAAGDQVLRETARACRSSLGPSALFARYGGEEFVALLSEVTPHEAELAAGALRAAVEALRLEHEGRQVPVTLSIGAAVYEGTPHDSLERCMRRADAALYASKANGRNQVTVAPAGVPVAGLAS